MCGVDWKKEQNFVFEMDDRKKKVVRGLTNLSAAERNKACGDWQIYVSRWNCPLFQKQNFLFIWCSFQSFQLPLRLMAGMFPATSFSCLKMGSFSGLRIVIW